MRFFNTAGPCDPRFHYMLPAAERLPEGPPLVEEGACFVVHAPRQTGKTTILAALAGHLTAGGQYAALLVGCAVGQNPGEDLAAVQRSILRSIRKEAELALPPGLQPPAPWPAHPAHPAHDDDALLLSDGLRAWAGVCPRPLVLFFDGIDALRGQGLINVLSQLRADSRHRPQAAPWSVVLCGLRDVCDDKAASGGDPGRMGTASPFHSKVKSLRLGSFTQEEIAALYAQHTADTGQPFEDQAVARAFELTRGQPWLVNALAREIIEEMEVAPPVPITLAHVELAKERLILARAIHLDSLVARLSEPRVRRIIEPLIAGTQEGGDSYDDDFAYVRDLGLIAPQPPARPANPIYREVIVRALTTAVDIHIPVRPFVLPDGRTNMDALLHAVTERWRKHGDVPVD